jgi:hypothetical protein
VSRSSNSNFETDSNLNITAFLQTRNELNTGHLARFFEWNSELYDQIVVLDDNSDDDSPAFLAGKCDLLILQDFQAFPSELGIKKLMLERAKENFPQTDWFLWLDADEILLTSRLELEELIKSAAKAGADGISLKLTNLWKSEYFYRQDNGFDDLHKVHLWKNTEKLFFNDTPGLHQPAHPKGLKKIHRSADYSVLHFGFSREELIVDKFKSYLQLGQRGSNLWRLIDEANAELVSVTNRIPLFGSRSVDYYHMSQVNALQPSLDQISDYFWKASTEISEKKTKKPFISIISLIYSGVDWLEFQYAEMIKLQKELGPGEVEILFVANDASLEVVDFLIQNNIPHVIAPGRLHNNEWYINSVYRAYNFGVERASGKYVLLTNSDMAYMPGFLYRILKHLNTQSILVGRLIESGRLTPGALAIERNLGKKLKSFKRSKFYKLATKISTDSLSEGGLFMPCLIEKAKFIGAGGYPEGNLIKDDLDAYLNSAKFRYAGPRDAQISGDTAFFMLLKKMGINHITVNSALAYHFQEGEKSTNSLKLNRRIGSGLAVCNDRHIGINGEFTVWNLIVETLTRKQIRVLPIKFGNRHHLPYRISHNSLWRNTRPRLVFRNATYLQNFKGPWRTISLLQDNVGAGKILDRQNHARKNSASEVTPSFEFLNKGIKVNHQYLIHLPVQEKWETTAVGKRKIDPHRFKCIFIGAFDDTKGWPEVRNLIEKYKTIDFILVSKYLNDDHYLDLSQTGNVSVHRNLSTEELIALVDISDFFLLGSPKETQCLAAIESAFRNIPICMKNTGLLSTLPFQDRNMVGLFDDDLERAFGEMIKRLSEDRDSFSPRDVLFKYGLNKSSLESKWMEMLLYELKSSFEVRETTKLTTKIRNYTPNNLKVLYRKLRYTFG